MLNLYPAIDLFEGQVVRLKRGDYQQKTVYAEDPALTAKAWEEGGTPWIHLVDLEGAKSGRIANLAAVKKIRQTVSCKLEFGGGIRSLDDIETLRKAGMDRVILGTKALEASFLEKALQAHGDAIAVGMDVRDGLVQTQGWLKSGGVSLEEALEALNKTQIKTIIYTDIQKDGMLEGPNTDKLAEVLNKAKARVILSGGVATLDDLKKCMLIKAPNFEGVIVGRALYEKKFTVKEAVAVLT